MTETFVDSSALFAWADAACPQNRVIHDFLTFGHYSQEGLRWAGRVENMLCRSDGIAV